MGHRLTKPNVHREKFVETLTVYKSIDGHLWGSGELIRRKVLQVRQKV